MVEDLEITSRPYSMSVHTYKYTINKIMVYHSQPLLTYKSLFKMKYGKYNRVTINTKINKYSSII